MGQYQTEQKKALMNFLNEHHTKQYTIEEIVSLMCAKQMREGIDGKMPGKSTIYRLMTQLVEDGSVKRFVKGNSRQFLYQAMDGGCKLHFHLKCTDCGQLIHADETFSKKIEALIGAEFAFMVDESRTMMYGLCAKCGGKTV